MQKNIAFKKSFSFDIKDVDTDKDSGIISGYASTFGNKDLVQDVMVKGCFQKTIASNKGRWPVLYNHQKQVGTNLEAREDAKGLFVISKIFKDFSEIPDAKEAWALIKANIKAGTQMGLSIGGLVKDYQYNKDEKTYEILEWDILEHSITATPCNQQANIEAHKNFENEASNFTKLEKSIEKLSLENKILNEFCLNLIKVLKKR